MAGEGAESGVGKGRSKFISQFTMYSERIIKILLQHVLSTVDKIPQN